MFALADCNNFYASCERLFQPRLEGKPLVVLSNNDGCVIARSEEAKSLQIAMGDPYFKIEKLIQEKNVSVFSSNYCLYGDVSRRVMSVLGSFAPRFEVYSIDECFLDLAGLPCDLTDYTLGMVSTVRQWTGIPISIGIAPSKTLAKIANRMAKKGKSATGPVLDWTRLPRPDEALAALPVEDIWGIAARTGKRLRALGIDNALTLRETDPRFLRGHFGVVMERIVFELRGVSCLPLEEVPAPRKQIMTSRSFGTRLRKLDDLRAAVAGFAARAGEKARTQGLRAQALNVFIHTSPFDTAKPFYSNGLTLPFRSPTSDSGLLIRAALFGLTRIFRRGHDYQKAGVMLLDLVPAGHEQTNLFEPVRSDPLRSDRLMAAVDRVNRTYGRQTIRFGSETISDNWRMKAQRKSPAYTASWKELPVVLAN